MVCKRKPSERDAIKARVEKFHNASISPHGLKYKYEADHVYETAGIEQRDDDHGNVTEKRMGSKTKAGIVVDSLSIHQVL